MKRICNLLLCLFLCSGAAHAQSWYQQRIDELTRENRELKERLMRLEEKLHPEGGVSSLDEELDVRWDNLSGLDQTDEVAASMAIGGIESNAPLDGFRRRLSAIDTILHVPYDERVRAYADIYMRRRAKSLRNAIIRYERYRPLFRTTFNKYGVPEQITTLCILESAVSTKAHSPVGALGIWQLMPETARGYGLQVDDLFGNDERCDVVKSTEVAAKVLSKLYSRLGDWKLVLLAYNCGEGRLRQSIIRTGGASDFWRLVSNLPKETQNYVPAFMGILYALNYPELID